jgi:lipoprotein-anchoring transpeptidase ErfK/SrfK
MAALVVAGTLAGTRAEAADTANSEAVVRRIVVSIPDRKLAVVENNEVVQVFDVAVGAPVSPSPTGTFTIVNRVSNPTYYHSGTVIAPGPRNPIGTRWIGLSQKGYGIHGTDQPSSIGYAKSHGCIRLRNADITRLWHLIGVGTPINVV